MSGEFIRNENCPVPSASFCSVAVIESTDRPVNSGSSNNSVSSTNSVSKINVEVCVTVYYAGYLLIKNLETFQCNKCREYLECDNNELTDTKQ